MKIRFLPLLLVVAMASLAPFSVRAEEPLRIFILGGEKTHGPGAHDHPRFLNEWTELLALRGAEVKGSMGFPSSSELDDADVLIMYRPDGGVISSEDRQTLARFLERGGGIVVLHAAIVSDDPHWFKTVVGGAWENGHSKWHEGHIGLYFPTEEHPITQGVSNFDIDDEIYYDLHIMPEARVLARSFHDPFTIAPQMWTFEKDDYRSFVWLQGHLYSSFDLPHFRALLLRGIAWAGHRDVNLLVIEEETNSLAYPEGGPTHPDKAAEKIDVHPDFDITLVADESMISNPISMDWDTQGRLWVAETPEYPYKHDRERPARDRITILEDTSGDGKMDSQTVFYEGLELVTSLVFYENGVIVTQAPDIFSLQDTTGDGLADTKEVIFTGFGTYDTHAVISNMRWGMDGWIYATQGYSGANPKSPDGDLTFGNLGSGVLRFKPDGSDIEMVSSKGSNTWGLDFAWDGELFFSQANGAHINHVVMPESVLARGRVSSATSYRTIEDHKQVVPIHTDSRPAYRQIDFVGGFTSASGSTIYTGGAWPEEFDGNHFVSEPTVFLVHRDVIQPAGSTYLATKAREEEFIAARDLWFAPVHHRVGPDGALYILDFYNQAVIHNDTRGPEHEVGNAAVRPDRDHKFGRVWRVQHKEAQRYEEPRLHEATPEDLVEALKHANGWFRMTAQRLLVEQGNADVALLLKDLLVSEHPDQARVHALWVLYHLGQASREVLAGAVADTSSAVRKNALRVIAEKSRSSSLSPGLRAPVLERASREEDPRVRLEALAALGAFSADAETARVLVHLYPSLGDAWLQSAAYGALRTSPFDSIEASFAADEPEGLRDLVTRLTNDLGSSGDAEEAARLVILVADQPPAVDFLKQAVLEALAGSLDAKAVPKWSPSLYEAFRELLVAQEGSVPAAALPLIARWDDSGALNSDLADLLARLREELEDRSLSDEYRGHIAVSLLGVSSVSPDLVPMVASLLGTSTSYALQRRVITALGEVSDDRAAREMVAVFPSLAPELQAAVLDSLLRRSEWTRLLLEGIEEERVQLGSLGPAGVHRLRQHPDATVASYAETVINNLRGAETQAKDEIIAQFLPVVSQPGNLENGRAMFQSCAACHSFEGSGGAMAPDLTGMGAHGPEQLLRYIIDPNRMVESNYLAYNVETRSGEMHVGLIDREHRNSIVLKNIAGEVEISRDDIVSMRSTGKSLMPEGYEALGAENLRDLITYLGAGDTPYRFLDLSSAFTADSTRGIYASLEATDQSLHFTHFGAVEVAGIPFEIAHPSSTPTGNNVVVLKGGHGFARTLPQEVEFAVGLAASRLHVLGGVAGWGYPFGNTDDHNVPALRVTVHYKDGPSEEFVTRNGLEFADYNGTVDVPGSTFAEGVVRGGQQVRWFSLELGDKEAQVERIVLNSFDNQVAPTVVSITAELPAE